MRILIGLAFHDRSVCYNYNQAFLADLMGGNMRWVYHSSLKEKEYDSFIYRGVEYQINKYRSPLEDYCRIFKYSFCVGWHAIFSFRFKKLILKDIFNGKFSVKKSFSNRNFKWYNGILSGQNCNNYMILKIENGKTINEKLLDKEECHHFYNKWIENIMSSNDYTILVNKYSKDIEKYCPAKDEIYIEEPMVDYIYVSEENRKKEDIEKYFINWYYDICKKYLPK